MIYETYETNDSSVIWIHEASCTDCVFRILQKEDVERKVYE
jgi:Ni,Fe-hydrogenase I small subunit